MKSLRQYPRASAEKFLGVREGGNRKKKTKNSKTVPKNSTIKRLSEGGATEKKTEN